MYEDKDDSWKVGNLKVRLQFWDSDGQKIFASMIACSIKDSDQVCFVYDTANLDSVLAIETQWMELALNNEPQNSRPILLIGNKIDQGRPVTSEVGCKLCRKLTG